MLRALRAIAPCLWLLIATVAACSPERSHPASAPAVTASPALAPSEVRVLTFNIRYGTANDGENAWPMRRAQVIAIITHHDPDVVGLQEALDFQTMEIRDALPGYQLIGVGRDDGITKGEYAAILFKSDRFTPVLSKPEGPPDSGTFWFSDTPDVVASKSWGNNITRICTWAHLQERSVPNRRLYIYNVHLDHESEPSRVRSARLLAERIRLRSEPRDPAIVTGDFNCGQTSEALRLLTAAAEPPEAPPLLADTYRTLHPAEPESATFHAFKGIRMQGEGEHAKPRDPGQRIDGILFTPPSANSFSTLTPTHAEIDRSSVDGKFPSDHFPLAARFAWSIAPEVIPQSDQSTISGRGPKP